MTAIKAIPTQFRGVNFRSRLEAKWAAMFTSLGLAWEYEPFDAKGYAPDFVLLGKDPVLVEVKPSVSLEEMQKHVPRIDTALKGVWEHDVLIVGAVPMLEPRWRNERDIGVLGEWEDGREVGPPRGWVWGPGCWNQCGYCRLVSFRSPYGSYRSRVCGHFDGCSFVGDPGAGLIQSKWYGASNEVQWKGQSPR